LIEEEETTTKTSPQSSSSNPSVRSCGKSISRLVLAFVTARAFLAV